MKTSEFADAVTAMLKDEKEAFQILLEKEDFDGIRDEIFEYCSNLNDN